MVFMGLLLAAPLQAGPDDIHKHPTSVSDEELFGALDLERPGLAAVKEAVAAETTARRRSRGLSIGGIARRPRCTSTAPGGRI